jgi:phage terminase large subunit-like protein
MEDSYGGSALARQEMDGEIVRDHVGAIFKREDIDANRVKDVPHFDRIIIALDPSTTSKAGSDRCGLIVLGCDGEEGYVLEDATMKAPPYVWATEAIRLYHLYEADCILSETNQGGDMVATLIHQIDPDVPVESRHARHSKARRAMPVGLLYARGRVHHVGCFAELEDELCAFGGPYQTGSPDRMDALVWGISELLLAPNSPRLYFL